jgi:hypothetical protein
MTIRSTRSGWLSCHGPPLPTAKRFSPKVVWRRHGTDIDRRGYRPAHCRRVRLCRRAWRCRHSGGTGRRDCAAIWGAIAAGTAASAPASGKTPAPPLSGRSLHLTFAMANPLNRLARRCRWPAANPVVMETVSIRTARAGRRMHSGGRRPQSQGDSRHVQPFGYPGCHLIVFSNLLTLVAGSPRSRSA